MNCRTICDHLSAYLDGELEAELAREVKAHLDSCERCREELDSLRELTGMLHALPRERAPEEIEREVVSYIEEDILLRKPRHRRWVVVAVKALAGLGVAAAVFLVAFSVYIYFAPYEPTPPEMMVASKSALDAKHGATDWKGGTAGPEASYGMADTADTRRQQQQPGTTTLAYRNGRATWDTSGARTKTGAVEGVQAVNGKLQVGETPGQLKPEDQPRGVVGTDLAHRRPSVTEVGKRVVPDTATPPRFAAPTLEMDRLAGATPAAKKKPTEPEFLNLVLEDDDFAAATQHIKTVAASLDIRSVDVGVEGTESLRRLILHAYFGETGRDTGKDESVLEREPVPKDKYRGDKVVEKELPAVVLVVEEEKLPGLVARLAVPRPRRVAKVLAGTERLGRAETTVAKPKTVARERVAETRGSTYLKDAEKAEDEGEKSKEDVTDRVLSELRRMEKEAETRTRVAEGREPMKTPAPGPAAKPSRQEGEQRAARAGQDAQKDLARRPGRDDLKKTLLEDALKEQAEEKKLVYLRIYLKQPRARSVPAASTAPASK